MQACAAALWLLAPAAGAYESAEPAGRGLFHFAFHAEQPTVTGSGPFALPPPVPFSPSTATLSAESQELVRGLVEAFLHRESLEEGEVECIGVEAGEVTSEMLTVAANFVSIVEQVLGYNATLDPVIPLPASGHVDDPAGAIEDKVNQIMQSPEEAMYAAQQAKRQNAQAEQSLGVFYGSRRLAGFAAAAATGPGLFLQVGYSIGHIVQTARQAVQHCLHADALLTLKRAAIHVQNMGYVGGHLIANGQDIVTELADGVTAYKDRDFHRFGGTLGIVLRKVLLSDAGDKSLPEGVPKKEVVVSVVEGLLRGFFGPGARLEAKLPGAPDVGDGPGLLDIDLHQCVGRNLRFFESVLSEVMWVFAKREGLNMRNKEMMQWYTTVSVTMMGVPRAMQKCGLGAVQQKMLEQAAAGLAQGRPGTSIRAVMPREGGTRAALKSRVEEQLATAVKDWAQRRWSKFGLDLGLLLQELAVTVYEGKYALDVDGVLRAFPDADRKPAALLPPASAPIFLLLLLAVAAGCRRGRGAEGCRARREAHLEVGAFVDSAE